VKTEDEVTYLLHRLVKTNDDQYSRKKVRNTSTTVVYDGKFIAENSLNTAINFLILNWLCSVSQ